MKRKSHVNFPGQNLDQEKSKLFALPRALFNCRPPAFRSRKPVPTKDAWRTGAVLTDATDPTFGGNIHPRHMAGLTYPTLTFGGNIDLESMHGATHIQI